MESRREKIDFSFADLLCAVLYTGKEQHPYAPSLKLKIHLVQAYYAIEEIQNAADAICDTNDHDGVARWLEQNILDKQPYI